MNAILRAQAMRNTLFLLVASVFFYEAYWTFSRSPLFTPWDFEAFWGGARALNLGLDPYNPRNLQALSIQAPYVSPLFLAELLQPLAHLPLMTAKMIWTALNFLEAAATIVILLSLSKIKLTLQSLILGTTLFMAFEPFSGTIYLGQTDILVVLALALSWRCLEHRRLFLAGLVVCLGATNPHLITGIGLYYLYRSLRRREYRLLIGMAAGGAALLASLLVHVSYSKEWLTTILLAKEHTEVSTLFQITLIHAFTYFLSTIPPVMHASLALASLFALLLGLIACVCSILI